jgi:hypothetical protein
MHCHLVIKLKYLGEQLFLKEDKTFTPQLCITDTNLLRAFNLCEVLATVVNPNQ